MWTYWIIAVYAWYSFVWYRFLKFEFSIISIYKYTQYILVDIILKFIIYNYENIAYNSFPFLIYNDFDNILTVFGKRKGFSPTAWQPILCLALSSV